MTSLKDQFSSFLKKNKNKRFAICTHVKADIDALSSAYTVWRQFPNSILCIPDEMNQGAQGLANHLGVTPTLLTSLNSKDFEGLIVCDTGAYVLLPQAKDWNIVLNVDHHKANGRDMNVETGIYDEESPSCAEVCFDILPKIDQKIATALSCGIIADTARFKSARQSTFSKLGKLLEKAKLSYSDALALSEPERPIDHKIALATACMRLEYEVVGQYLIATTNISAHEGDAASVLSEVADVVFVASHKPEEKETRVSARARKNVPIPLNEVMKEVGQRFNGKGGGHPKASGCSAQGTIPVVLKACIEVFKNHLFKS